MQGWLAWTDAVLMARVVEIQRARNAIGAVVEIGVHHGKSIRVLARLMPEASLYAIDVFERQEANIDGSGAGDREIFEASMRDVPGVEDRLTIDARASNEVTADDILTAVGPVAFFHIDGGHNLDAVKHDLELAEKCIAPEGVIVVDDVFRPQWPEVSIAVGAFLNSRAAQFTLVAHGQNKSLLVRRACADIYRHAIEGDRTLTALTVKDYRGNLGQVKSLCAAPSPAWGLRRQIGYFFLTFYPKTYIRVRRYLRG